MEQVSSSSKIPVNRKKREGCSRSSYESGPAPKLVCADRDTSENEDSKLNSRRIHCKMLLTKYAKFALSSITPDTELHSGMKNQRFINDDDGHLNFDVGDIIIERYKLLGFLGKGSFGRVAKAYDMQECRTVALKIVRNIEVCRESGKTEINFMKKLARIDPEGKYLWVRMLDYFEFSGHIFIAFEKLGDDLYTFLRENKFQPYQLTQIRHIAYQIMYSVKALHDYSIIHTDLKPENICFENSEFTYGIRSLRLKTYRKVVDSTIRLIDFGSAMYSLEDYLGCIQTRHYRSPEVVFGMEWSYACDVWSIGCILFELYTGSCLFLVSSDEEHVNAMRDVLGPIPDIYKGTILGKRVWEDYVPLPQRKPKTGSKPLRKYMSNSSLEHSQLFDLIEALLHYDQEYRIPLSRALKHPFFKLLPNNLKSK